MTRPLFLKSKMQLLASFASTVPQIPPCFKETKSTISLVRHITDIKSSKLDRSEKKKKEEETVTETEADEKKEEKKPGKSKEEEDKKKKKKVKLEVHDVQVFNDDKDVYVWIFDPTPLYKKVIGFLMVLGTIVGCLFPLWPIWLRQAVYYLSLAGIGVFGVIVVVAILRTILFGLIWFATMGQHKLWILPNLTEVRLCVTDTSSSSITNDLRFSLSRFNQSED
ncbi:translocation protein Sec62 [Oesophagostomum dentatum]|uniref:Translocation protein SEC62 n=1 Tax=Oesophagostomum dentatum TaxID=61180 RepID=A0A0B1T8G0_OESDE|nr:translocation protein Sec62 [Oesophagostomum dentatum]